MYPTIVLFFAIFISWYVITIFIANIITAIMFKLHVKLAAGPITASIIAGILWCWFYYITH